MLPKAVPRPALLDLHEGRETAGTCSPLLPRLAWWEEQEWAGPGSKTGEKRPRSPWQ